MKKIKADKLVYILGEEMARHSMQLVLDNWVAPYVDISGFEYYSLSVADRANSDDKVLKDAITAGQKIKAIFKEPTITPTAEQMTEFGFAGKKLGSPNGKMRQAWNGFAISRDPIFVPGLEDKFGYKGTVIFDRHAVGGEYQALYANNAAKGKIKTIHIDASGKETVLNEQPVDGGDNAVVTYVNDYNNLPQLAAHFFQRCIDNGCKPFVVTKKTVFKWQEPFYDIIAKVFEKDWRGKLENAKLVDKGAKLPHLLSDDAAMRSIRWKEGKFGMVAHNYDGDWLTDEQAQMFGSPGLIASVMTGVADDGKAIKMFEAAHGTMADLWAKHKAGEETSVNPIGMVHGFAGAMVHAAKLNGREAEMKKFTDAMMNSLYETYAEGKGSRDFCGADGLSTDGLIKYVAEKIKKKL